MNDMPQTNEPIRVTIRRIALGPYIKWYTLAFTVLGSTVAAMCTAWYILDGQLRGKAIISYFLAIVLYYAVPGLIGSILFAVIYNSFAGRIAGLQFDIVVQQASAPPSPPEGWEGTLPKIDVPDKTWRA
jgi:ABC-type Fe3+ transport system permease subunit